MTTQLLSFKKSLLLIAPALLLTLAAPYSIAADIFGPPSTVDYQGRLLDSTGTPFGDTAPTNYELRLRLYDAETGGAIVWAEKQIVTVSKGLFSVRLGEGNAILGAGAVEEGTVGHASPGLPGAFNGKERFLGVTVVLPGQANPAEIIPRLSFLASPFSYVAGTAQVAQSVNQPAGSPPSSLNVGSISYVPLVLSASATLGGTNSTVLADATSATVAATLPSGTAADKKEITVTKTDASANPVTVPPPGGGSINGSASPITLSRRGDSVTLRNTDANNWIIVSRYSESNVVADSPIAGGLLARGGAPGVQGVNRNGYAFSGNGGDNDSGLFSTQDGKISLYTNAVEKVYLDNDEFTTSANFTANNFASFFGTVNFTGATTLNGVTTVGNTFAMNDRVLKLRGTGDGNHWLSYRSSFAGYNIDGPVLSGASGGILGSTGGGEAGTLVWQRINGRGHVGINGNTSNEAVLRVNGAGDSKGIGSYGFLASGGAGAGGGTNANYGIWSDGRMLCAEYNAASDARIKQPIGVSDSPADLTSLMQLKVTNYTFRDTVAQGKKEQKKLIAQEVEKVVPNAVSKVTNVVPDIMKKAPLLGGWITLPTDLKQGERVRILADGYEAAIYEVLEAKPAKFRTSFTGDNKEVFVYGREVKDFRTVDYDAISMLNVSATQQVKKDSDTAEEALRKEVEELRAKLAALEKKNTERETRLTALETALLGKPAGSGATKVGKVTAGGNNTVPVVTR